MHIWQGGFWLHTREGSGFDCLGVDGKGEISGCLHGKGGILAVHGKGGNLAAGTEWEGSGCCHGKWVSWLLARGWKDSGCRHRNEENKH
jgi:hypothetical protein